MQQKTTGKMGMAILAGYLGTGWSCSKCQVADKPSEGKGLEFKVSEVCQGVKDKEGEGQYSVDAQLSLENPGETINKPLMWFYSLCFEVPKESGEKVVSCVDGKSIPLDALSAGERRTSSAHLEYRGGTRIFISEKGTLSIFRLEPKITNSLEAGREVLFRQDYRLPPIGEYSCAGKSPDK